MPGLRNNLYPPIVASWMPAFVRTTPCKVYFSLSDYNSLEDIRNAQVIVNYQNSNLSALDTEKYPTSVMITDINVDNTVRGNSKYYINIYPRDLEGEEFELNQYYKVQIRFTSVSAEPLTDSKKIASWLVNNQQYFSEWSTVCVVKGIEQPQIYIKGFESDNSDIVFTSESISFIGEMYYDLNADIEKEYLKSYEINVYNNFNDELVYSSGIVYTEVYNPNEINYVFSYLFEDGVEYRADITYTTNNNYQNTVSYTFSIIANVVDVFNANIEATPELEYGRMKIHVFSDTERYFGNLVIKRTSNESNFTLWEDIKMLLALDDNNLDVTWYDYTVECGVWYKYCAQKINVNNERGALVQTTEPSMVMLDDMFLTQDNFQLRVRYDPSVSSFKHVISESVTETIGSKYPFFKRNGVINYKQFPISGLITHFCDDEGVFLNRNNIYKDAKIYYDKYNEDENIDQYQDYIYEREFRNKIIDFLYEDNVKLFRSATEGNVLVKLMNVSFSPNQVLGRMLYSFSADAYEVDECSISNYNKYNVLNIGEVDSYVEFVYNKVGQISETFSSSQNVLTYIQSRIDDAQEAGYVDTIRSLSWLRLYFESDPYPVRLSPNGTMEPVLDGNIDDNCLLGYIVYINGNPIFVNRKGYYELADEDTAVTSLSFPTDTKVMVDYIGEIVKQEEQKRKVVKLSSATRAGQFYDIFNPNTTVIQQIYLKYHASYESFYQDLISIDKLSIEGIPGTVVFIKDSYDEKYDRHVIGDTSILTLSRDDAVFIEMYFNGIHFNPALDESAIRLDEYVDTGISVPDEESIEKPVYHGVYTINGERKIYYDSKWYTFNEQDDVICPVEAFVNYEYEIIKGEY